MIPRLYPTAVFTLILAGIGSFGSGESSAPDKFARDVVPVLTGHCYECHNAVKSKGDIDMSGFLNEEQALTQPELWDLVREVLEDGEMPPRKAASHPSPEEVELTLKWIEESFESGQMLRPERLPGRTTMRRLNRAEYRYAVLDLFGVDYPTVDRLPADGVAHGFDVIGEALTMPPILFEKYFEAAEQIARAALPSAGEETLQTRRFAAEELELSDPDHYSERAKAVYLFSNGSATARVSVERSGEYLVRVMTGAQQAGDELAKLRISVDNKPVEVIEVEAELRDPAERDVRVVLEMGSHSIAASFINDYYNPDAPDPNRRDRNLGLAWIELVGPLGAPTNTAFQSRFMNGAEGTRKSREVLQEVVTLAWRSPLEEQTINALLQIAEPEADENERVRSALAAILTSPRFLFRVEPEPQDSWRALNGFELATRLAAFLWNSVPDAELLDMATTGELLRSSGLEPQVRRMLRDARASRLSSGFANQWLQLGRLSDSDPDAARFPTFNADLRQAMERESELFFEAILRENRPVDELLSADFTFVNEALAKHYGILGVSGQAMQRVPWPASLIDRRCGVLGQAGSLTASSQPTRTSPVKRGKWVMDSLLGTPPSPPPPGVGALDESHKATSSASIRERLAAHRANPECATCHDSMDGLGLALENFNAIGLWRDSDGDFAIDANAQLPTGPAFEGPAGLRDRLLGDGSFRRGLLRHLMTYALGRGLVDHDEDELDKLIQGLPSDVSLSQLIQAIVRTDAFQRHYRDSEQS